MADFDGDDRGEVLDIHPEPPHRRARVLVVCLLIVLAGGLALWGVGGRDSSAPAPSPTPTPARVLPTPTPSPRTDPPASVPPRSREQLRAHTSWLAARTGYTLFVRTADAVYRVRPRGTAMIRTRVPGVRSGGPVSFVPTRHGILIHPWDTVPAYAVPDDGPAHRSAWRGGVVLPGPDPEHVWTEPSAQRRLTLTDAAGRHASATMRIPGPYVQLAAADGQGYAIVSSTGGVYSLRPGGTNRIANGRLLAVGPTRVIVSQCDPHAVCHATLLDASFATVRSLPAISLQRELPSGAISPDGTVAAMVDGYTRRLSLVNLDTGRTAARTGLVLSGSPGGLAFSPDSRWLFAVDTDGRAHAVDVRTGKVRDLLPRIHGILQLAVRPSAPG